MADAPDLDATPRHFQCSTCKSAFTRADHLTRHVRAHTRSKPYICDTCSKGFSRVDLLKRHAAGCAAQGPSKRRKTGPRPSRVPQACESCAQNHLRCEYEKPCSRCRSKDIECKVASAVGSDLSGSLEQPRIDSAQHDSALADQLSPRLRDGHVEAHLDPTLNMVDNSSLDAHSQMLMLPFESCPSGMATPRGIMDFSFDWDIDLTDLDMGFLDQYNQQAPFAVQTPSTDAHGSQGILQQATSDADDGVSVRHEAFKRSVWRYLPQSNRDFGAAEQPNLAFGDAEMESSCQQAHLATRRAVQERLSRATRDKLLALVLGTCAPTNIARIASAFPTVELLDGLLQYFLSSPSLDTRSWFHVPTFSPSNLRPELLANMIAAGAVSTPDIPLRKLGFALYEASRVGISKAFEEDNTSIRDLQHVQTLMISLEIGMWSGISRKMEIAESFLQPLITMLRRGGRFRRSTWKDIAPQADDEGQALENIWHKWVLQELYLRLVYRAFEHDRQASMALLKPPLISYSELQLPLPHSDVLWNATSAQAWKLAYLSHFDPASSAETSSAGCILNLDPLRSGNSAGLVYLYMVWGMVWEHKQMEAAANRMHSLRTNSLVLPSRHLELTKYFEDFCLSSTSAPTCSVSILVELMLMHLNAPLDEIQLFAGIEGVEEAHRVHPSLQLWVQSAPARQALWHAAQVLRAARHLTRGLIRNFNAIAVYHAGLVLWGYGCLISTSLRDGHNQTSSLICLDSDDSTEIRRFITLDRGTPALKGRDADSPDVPIWKIGNIMDILVYLLKSNHEGVEGSCPPLVDNLVQLMHGLSTATSDRSGVDRVA